MIGCTSGTLWLLHQIYMVIYKWTCVDKCTVVKAQLHFHRDYHRPRANDRGLLLTNEKTEKRKRKGKKRRVETKQLFATFYARMLQL